VAAVRVLLSAYACEPGKGSEQEVGLRAMLAAAQCHEVWVLTRDNNVPPLTRFLREHPHEARIHLEGLDLDGTIRAVKRAGKAGLHLYYDAWQQAAAARAAELDRVINFDLVHHVTFATFWTRAGVSGLDKPFVWGPVGGGVTAPMKLAPELGLGGVTREVVREVTRRLAVTRGHHRATTRAASLILAQNKVTARRIKRDDVTVLPNALSVQLATPAPSPTRNSDIALVGTLIPLKGGHLAIRMLRHLQHPAAVLRVYGEGPDKRRLQAAARRHGVADRVEFMGRVARDVMLDDLRRCGVLLHPSLKEESSLSVAEALTLGVPVVGLDHGGPAEVVRWWPGSDAIMVEPGWPSRTAELLASAIDQFLTCPPPVPRSVIAPSSSFASALLAAYEKAVR
jgi:glycosyltransferase involved in cell wall biosynthesis